MSRPHVGSLVAAAALLVAPLAPSVAAAQDTNEDAPPRDLIDYGSGAFPIRAETSLDATVARAVLDGLGGFVMLPGIDSEGPDEPVALLIELPAPTVFHTFAVPPMSRFGCCSNTHIATVTVEGSASGPDDGFEELVTFTVAPDVYDRDQEFAAMASPSVRWLRVTLDGRGAVDPDDYRGTSFTDLRGYGEQEAREAVADEFTGIFLTGGGGSGANANRIQLRQDGALVVGCRQGGGAVRAFSGGIEDGILKVLSGDGIPSLYVIGSDGRLLGVEVGRSFGRTVGEVGGNPIDCAPLSGEGESGLGQAIDACETAVLYGVNFDVDSDQLRPDAEPALREILTALEARPGVSITIEGHTDSDASDEYNLDLSNRRTASVRAWLIERGIDAARLTAVGKGESEPVADNETAAGKAANRRVEIEPACAAN